mmetsp:Transcript_81976/g.232181  ORF Transcript_81976/g.232181 Transcript_81976/m.232181 type:complete len:296 (+) Transcript_81976:329-1216(+)
MADTRAQRTADGYTVFVGEAHLAEPQGLHAAKLVAKIVRHNVTAELATAHDLTQRIRIEGEVPKREVVRFDRGEDRRHAVGVAATVAQHEHTERSIQRKSRRQRLTGLDVVQIRPEQDEAGEMTANIFQKAAHQQSVDCQKAGSLGSVTAGPAAVATTAGSPTLPVARCRRDPVADVAIALQHAVVRLVEEGDGTPFEALGVRGGARKTWWVIHRRRRRRQGEASATGSRWRKRADDTIRYETALLGTRPPTKPHGWRWERYRVRVEASHQLHHLMLHSNRKWLRRGIFLGVKSL